MRLKRKILLTLILLGFFLHKGYAQTASISGVVNHYAVIEEIFQEANKSDSLLVRNLPPAFKNGDTVMVYVVKGAGIRLVESPPGADNIGEIGATRSAGQYAFLIITNILKGPVDTIVVLNATMFPNIEPLEPDEVAQLIRIPSYNRAVVTGEITAPSWNGATGGVVSMFVRSTLTLNADIDVSGLGFKGANWDLDDDEYEGDCSSTDIVLYDDLYYGMSPVLAGKKGEGITSVLFDLLRGKGKNINGGGGGNGKLSGGGGGGNYSGGGQGGEESDECIPNVPDQGGLGGDGLGESFYLNEVDASPFFHLWNRVSFGGGGGAGVRIDGIESSPGANGGGLVVIVADTIDGINGAIRADGESVSGAMAGAGGGGGAGGAIILDVSGYKNNPLLSAVGGKGGDATWGDKTGPGGGGGGGISWLAGEAGQNVQVENIKGMPGVLIPAFNPPSYGALEGGAPKKKNGLEAPLRGFLFNTLPTEDSVCSDQVPDTVYASKPKGGSGDYSYQWVDSSATQSAWLPVSPEDTFQNLGFSSPLDQTTYFRRIVSDPKVTEPDISFRFAMYVHQAITDNTIAAPDTVCRGEAPEAFTSVGSPGNGNGVYTYLWQMAEVNKPFIDAEGSNNQPGYVAPTLDTTSIFRRVVTSGACVDTLALLTVDVFQPISGNLIADDDTICWNTMPALITQDPEIGLGGGDPDLTNWRYRWESAPADAGPWVEVPAAVSPDYQPGNLTATTWYRREVLSGNDDACRDMSLPVEILNVPVITGNEIITADQNVCTDDQPALMEGSGPAGGHLGLYAYLWESRTESTGWVSADNTNGNNQQSYTSPVMSGDTTIYRRIVSSGGQEGVCKDTSVTKTINVLPAIFSNTISTSVTLNCQYDRLSDLLGSLPDGGATEGGNDPTRNYRWEQAMGVDAPGAWTEISYGPTEQDFSDMPELSTTDDYWYRRVVLSGPDLGGQNQVCTSTSDTIHVVIHTAISNNLIDPSDSVCFNTEKELQAQTPAGELGFISQYSWRDMASAAELGTTEKLNYTFTSLDDRQFNRIVIIGACEDTSNIMDITVMELPGGTLSGNIPEACEELVQLDVELNVGSITNYNTNWVISFSNGVDTELVDTSELDANSSAHKVDVNLTNPDDVVSTLYNYSIGRIVYELSDGTQCVAPSENLSGVVPIEVFHTPRPEITINTPLEDSSICGDVVELSVAPDKGTGFWSNDNSAKLRFVPDAQDTEVNASVDPSYADAWDQLPYWIYFTSTAGVCSDYDSVGIYFFEQPDPAFAKSEDTIYFTNSVRLNANPPTAGEGTWTSSNMSVQFRDGDVHNPNVIADGLTLDANNEFTWTIVNGVCSTSFAKSVIYQDKAQPYEGFSPNGDGVNDYFIIRGLAEPGVKFSISIFNSLGNSVRTINEDNVEEIAYDPASIPGGLRSDEKVVWDGKSNNGNMVPGGTYYYVLNANIDQYVGPPGSQEDKHYILVRY